MRATRDIDQEVVAARCFRPDACPQRRSSCVHPAERSRGGDVLDPPASATAEPLQLRVGPPVQDTVGCDTRSMNGETPAACRIRLTGDKSPASDVPRCLGT